MEEGVPIGDEEDRAEEERDCWEIEGKGDSDLADQAEDERRGEG